MLTQMLTVVAWLLLGGLVLILAVAVVSLIGGHLARMRTTQTREPTKVDK